MFRRWRRFLERTFKRIPTLAWIVRSSRLGYPPRMRSRDAPRCPGGDAAVVIWHQVCCNRLDSAASTENRRYRAPLPLSSSVPGILSMHIEERLAQNHTEFQALLDRMEEAVEAGRADTAIGLAEAAASIAWLQGCGIFSSPRLESLLARLGKSLHASPSKARPVGANRHVLTIMSSAHAVGGHTRLACRWMALDTRSTHTLLLTRQGEAPLPRIVEILVEQGRIRVARLDNASPVSRVAQLRQWLGSTDLAVLHVHPNDVLPVVALAGMEAPPPVLFEDHASHVFWVGASVSNLVVTLIEGASRIAVARRGVPPAQIGWMPIPLEFAAPDHSADIDIRARFGIPHDAPLLMSCGAPYKFRPIDGVSLAELMAPLLAERTDLHLLLVGPSTDPPGTSLATDHPGRVHLAGNITEPAALHAAYAACDIYLDAAPFPSNTALCEAVIADTPTLKFAPQTWSECGFTVDLDAIPLPIYVARDADDYRHRLRTLLD